MSIDPSKIRPGDTVKVRFQSMSMEQAGVAPIEFTTTAYAGNPHGDVWAGGLILLEHAGVTILEHIPARPDWADALVVQSEGGHVWGKIAGDYEWHRLGTTARCNTHALAENGGSITVVLDANGNPPAGESDDPGAADSAWIDYSKNRDLHPNYMVAVYRAFHAGWEASR